MALQYLEALKALGASPSTKFLIPIEFTRFAERIGDYVESGITSGSGGTPVVHEASAVAEGGGTVSGGEGAPS